MAENAEKLVSVLPFSKSMNFNAPSITDDKSDTKQHEKHHKIRSKPNMKPQTQCETTASRSFIRLGSQIPPPPPVNVTRHDFTPNMKQRQCLESSFELQQLVEIASQGCPCQVQQQCCFMWGLVTDRKVCGPLRVISTIGDAREQFKSQRDV